MTDSGQAEEARPALKQLNRLTSRMAAHHRSIVLLVMLFVMFYGLWLRLENLAAWRAAPEDAFFEKEPLLTTFDGYFYLRMARDLCEGTYTAVDTLRTAPQGRQRPSPPPLLSVILAQAADVTPFSLNWIGAVLPAGLGILAAIPLCLLGLSCGGRIAGLTAALVGLASPYYIGRSGLGWCDTDCMNVTWVLLITYCFLRCGTGNVRQAFLWGLTGLASTALFRWWWPANEVVVAAGAIPMIVALAAIRRRERRSRHVWIVPILAVMAIAAALWATEGAHHLIKKACTLYAHIAKSDLGFFPNTAATIAEQLRPTVTEAALWTVGSRPAAAVAIVGLLLMLYRDRRMAAYLVVPLGLGCLSALAIRFLLFLVPLFALGIGFAASECIRLRHRVRWMPWALVLLPALFWNLHRINSSLVQWPAVTGATVGDMVECGERTPDDAIIWALWDHGYAINYWARRATIADGQAHGGELLLYSTLPFATDNALLAANFMRFYSVHGLSGARRFYEACGGREQGVPLLRKVLASSPNRCEEVLSHANPAMTANRPAGDHWREFLFPEQTRPSFLFVELRLLDTAPHWMNFGNLGGENPATLQDQLNRSVSLALFTTPAAQCGVFRKLADRDAAYQLWGLTEDNPIPAR